MVEKAVGYKERWKDSIGIKSQDLIHKSYDGMKEIKVIGDSCVSGIINSGWLFQPTRVNIYVKDCK